MAQYRWRISILGKTPARELGTFVAPTEEAAIERSLEVMPLPEGVRFRLAARCLGEVEEDQRGSVKIAKRSVRSR